MTSMGAARARPSDSPFRLSSSSRMCISLVTSSDPASSTGGPGTLPESPRKGGPGTLGGSPDRGGPGPSKGPRIGGPGDPPQGPRIERTARRDDAGRAKGILQRDPPIPGEPSAGREVAERRRAPSASRGGGAGLAVEDHGVPATTPASGGRLERRPRQLHADLDHEGPGGRAVVCGTSDAASQLDGTSSRASRRPPRRSPRAGGRHRPDIAGAQARPRMERRARAPGWPRPRRRHRARRG